MDFIALLDMRPMHWYVYVPALACGSPLANRDDAEAAAAALVTTATGLPPADFHITLHVAHGAAMVVQDPHTEVDVRHRDGAWYTAEPLGWLRTWDGGWQALVSCSAEGASWERQVKAATPGRCVPTLQPARPGVTSEAATVTGAGCAWLRCDAAHFRT